MKNKLLTITFLLSLSHHQMVFSQQDVIPPDPIVEAMTVFGDIPVSHMTGVPDISIPLFTLESHGYKLPIVLRYHTALVKPPYDQTNVATGWVLEVGGNITQQCKGMNDLFGTFSGEGYRYLDKILCKNENGNTENTYEFSYNQGIQTIVTENIHADYWGYLNGNNLDQDEGLIDLAQITVQNVACYPSTTEINIGAGHKDPNEIFEKH